ncbi:MAG: DUF512 domain-containing protein [Thermomicrobiales bacterium]|nr:DUF512 domain-containing protein [Thermomicrobiales bacterium]
MSRTCMRTLPGKQIQVRRYLPEEALAVVRQAEVWQERFLPERGTPFFYLGDEFYLMTGLPTPESAHYGGFPQIEDGIGITRHFLDRLDDYMRRTRRGSFTGARGTIACATLIGPTMREAVDRFNAHTGAVLEVVAVENVHLGSEINVSGLLSGHDLLEAFRGRTDEEPLFISDRMISQRTGVMLDDMSLEDVTAALQRPVVPAADLPGVASVLRQRQRDRAAA